METIEHLSINVFKAFVFHNTSNYKKNVFQKL